MKTPLMRFAFASGLLMLLAACPERPPAIGTETYAAFCDGLEEALPSRSRSDTQQTQDEIEALYARAQLLCPGILLPGQVQAAEE